MIRILAIDPGKISGYALFVASEKQKPKLIQSDCIPGDATKNDFNDMRGFIYNIEADILIIETQFFHPKRKAKNLMQLLENRFAWEFFARSNGCVIIRVDPAEWQNYWKLKSNLKIKNKTKRSKDFKQQIIKKARKIIRRRRVKENEADAILIGLYWIRSKVFKEYIERIS